MSKQIRYLLVLLLPVLSAGVFAADPEVSKPILKPVMPLKPVPQLNLQPDLTITFAGPSCEFWDDTCDMIKRDLRLLHNSCGWHVGVKNIGNAPSPATQLVMSSRGMTTGFPYTFRHVVPVRALRPGETVHIRIPSSVNKGYFDNGSLNGGRSSTLAWVVNERRSFAELDYRNNTKYFEP